MDQLETQPIDQEEIPMLDVNDMPPGITCGFVMFRSSL